MPQVNINLRPTFKGASRHGMLTIQHNTADVIHALNAYALLMHKNIGTLLGRTALYMEGVAKRNTRVDTGRLRSSLHTILPGTTDSFSYSDKRGGSFEGSLGVTAAENEAYMGTNVTYGAVQNFGSAKMVGSHFMEKATVAGRDKLRSQLAEAHRKAAEKKPL